MTIQITRDGGKAYAKLTGRIDTVTVGQAEKELKAGLDTVTEYILDFKQVDYISSAGLRLLLSLQKTMNKQGSMKLINVSEMVSEIFDVTGFADILTIE